MGTLVPVNMQTSTQDALDKLVRRDGNLDEYVSDRLGYEPGELGRYFGAEQIDALGLAIDNVERGAGFILGDQTGVGKGRVVAAMIRYALKSGRTPIFVTEKANLYGDMYRDLTDVGVQNFLGRGPRILMTNANETVPLNDEGTVELKTPSVGKHDALLEQLGGEHQLGDYDMIFTTYSQMQTVKGLPTTRMRFLEAMAPGSILIFDESHNAGGSKQQGKKKGKGDKENLNRAIFARRLAREAHGVVYSSATYAKRPEVMDLYSTTDMRFAVADVESLGDAIQRGGVPMQQVVASMLASSGQYIRRERSFDGVKYNSPVVKVNRNAYGDFSKALAAIQEFSERYIPAAVKQIDEEIKAGAQSIAADMSIGRAGASSSHFTSVMHNLVDQLLLSITADPAADKAIAALKNGEKPVITVANTMASFLADYTQMVGIKPGDKVDLDFNKLLERYLDRTRWITVRRPFMKKGEKGERRYLTDDELGPMGVMAFNKTKAMIGRMDFSALPVSPIDHIRSRLKEAGYKVDEITGRTDALDYRKDGAYYRVRPASEMKIAGRRKAISGFNSGKIDALIVNQAGSTGLSLHASKTFKDQRKRRMIIAQAEKNIDTHMQMLGRVHRTGQVIAPEYDQLVADVPAVKRPAAVLAKKMASLNANTTASRGGTLKAENTPDFMNSYGDEVVARLMGDLPEIHDALDNPLAYAEEGYEQQDAARKVTGRIPLLPIEQQEILYDMIESDYLELVAQKEAAGESILEAKTLALDAKTLDRRQVVAPAGSNSPFADGVYVEAVDVKRLGKPYTTDQVLDALTEELGIDRASLSADNMSQAVIAGRKAAEATIEEQKKQFAEYRRGVVAKIEDPEQLSAWHARLDGLFRKFVDIAHVATVGQSVRLETNTGNHYGVVTKVERKKGQTKNPVALGSWKVTLAAADSSRKLTLSMSQLDTARGAESTSRATISVAKNITDDITVIRAFDTLQNAVREKRTIITGNLLAGFEHVRGRGSIVNYTDNEENVRQGILMPRGYNYDKEQAKAPVSFHTSQQVLAFLRLGSSVKSADNAVSLTLKQGNVVIDVAGSKSRGGRYYLDRPVLAALGGDFVRAGNVMRAEIPEVIASPVIDALKNAGAVFRATENLKAARKIVGEVSSEDADVDLLTGEPEHKGKGIGVRKAKQFVDQLVSRWAHLPARIVVTTRRQMLGVPEKLKQQINARDPLGTARGVHVHSLNAIFIFADNAKSRKRLARTIVHEILGHYAAYQYFGPNYRMVADFMLQTFPDRAHELARIYRQDLRTTKGRNIVGNEVIAWLATEMESGTPTQRMRNAWQRFVLWLNDMLRKMLGMGFSLTELEARRLIRQASEYVRSGRGAPTRGASQRRSGVDLMTASNETRRIYEARIDELLSNPNIKRSSLRELKMLDDGDVLALIGRKNLPVYVREAHAIDDGRYNHPLTAADWKKMPDWVDNPALVLERKSDGRLTMIGPELVDGRAVVIGLEAEAEPDRRLGTLERHLVLTAYGKDRGVLPLQAMIEEGTHIPLYVDQNKAPSFYRGSGVPFPGNAAKLRGSNRNLKTNRDLVKYRHNDAESIDFLTDPDNEDELNFELADERERRGRTFIGAIKEGQPIDRAFRLPFLMFGSIDDKGQFHLDPRFKTVAAKSIGHAAAMMQSPRFEWLRHTAGMAHSELVQKYGIDDKLSHAIETAKRGLIDRYGVSKEYVERDFQRQADERALLMEALDVLKQLTEEGVGAKEAEVLYRVLTGKEVTDAHMEALAEPIRDAIDRLGQEAVELGFISPESYERNRGAYLHRTYKKHESELGGLARWANDVTAQRRRRIIGNQFKGRGIFLERDLGRVLKDVPADWYQSLGGTLDSLKGQKIVVLDKMASSGDRVLKRVYWPADLPVPNEYASFENKGTFEIRSVRKQGGKQKLTLWRDFTEEELKRMGEIVDARYAIAKTYLQMARDLSTGRFFRDIADNPEWASDDDPTGDSPNAEESRLKLYAETPWVRVPETKIGKSNAYRYGALAGKYVRSEIWRDMVEIVRMQKGGFWREVMRQWKLNKTARNPVVHFNNVMSNMLLMDMIDVRWQDLYRGLRSYYEEDEHYKAAFQHGAFGSDMMSKEIKDTILKPILAQLEKEQLEQSGAKTGVWGLGVRVLSMLRNADRKFIEYYRIEDEWFRMATYMRQIGLGYTPEQAAIHAREQFLNYDVRAPWINALRESVLPFITYTYRAIPIIARSLASRPWKLAKYFTIAYLLNALGYALGGDRDDEDEERATLPAQERGRTWTGVYRMLRTPFHDHWGNPIFLDTRRFIPSGDIFDLNQGSSALPIPAPFNFGGPLMIGAELMMNRAAFDGDAIVNELTDTPMEKAEKVGDFLWKAYVPSAPWIPGSWYFSKITRAAFGELDPRMREYSLPLAISSSLGLKLKPQDVALQRRYLMMDLDQVDRALDTELNALAHDLARRKIDRGYYDEQVQEIVRKKKRVAEQRKELAPQ